MWFGRAGKVTLQSWLEHARNSTSIDTTWQRCALVWSINLNVMNDVQDRKTYHQMQLWLPRAQQSPHTQPSGCRRAMPFYWAHLGWFTNMCSSQWISINHHAVKVCWNCIRYTETLNAEMLATKLWQILLSYGPTIKGKRTHNEWR